MSQQGKKSSKNDWWNINAPENDPATIGRPELFRDGDWVLINDSMGKDEIVSAHHLCRGQERYPQLPQINHLPSRNVVVGRCARCHDLVPDSIAVLWRLYNWDTLYKHFGSEMGYGEDKT